jgi:hypothetical protein
MKIALILASAAFVATAAPALAQSETTTTVTRTTTTTVVPDTVRTYVVGQQAQSVAVPGDVVIGEVLPEIVSITPIPDNAEYGYAVVNDRRVVIDPVTRTVIEVYD